MDQKDIKLLAENCVKVVHNPESNMKLASGIAPVPDMLSSGIIVGMGTDGCASNNDMDLFTEMDIAAKIHKLETGATTVMDALTVLRMATIEGAKALGISNITGSIEIGKKADIIVVDINKPHLTPMYNPYSHLVYSAKGSDVSYTIINGRLLMAERKLLIMDISDVITKARSISKEVLEWLRSDNSS